MGIMKNPVAIIDVLDSEKKVTNHEIEYHVTYEADGPGDTTAAHFTPKVVREEVSEEEVAKFRGVSASGATATMKKQSELIHNLQEEITLLKKKLEEVSSAAETAITNHKTVLKDVVERHNIMVKAIGDALGA